MTPEGAECRSPSALGKLHSVISLVREQTLIRKATHHPTHRRGSKCETLRDLVRSGGAGSFADRVDRFEIVFDRLGQCLGRRGVGSDGLPCRAHAVGPALERPVGWPRTISTGNIEM